MKKRKVAFYNIILQGSEDVSEMKVCLANMLQYIQVFSLSTGKRIYLQSDFVSWMI